MKPNTASAARAPGADFDLPAHLDATLRAIGLDVTAAQRTQLLNYAALLQRWNAVYNLTAVRDLAGIATLHLADCLAAVPAVAACRPRRILDVGSGGGLPGIIFAILLPDTEVHLVDTVQKKCAFLQQTAGSLGLRNVRVHHARVETLVAPEGGFDLITSRAFSELALLAQATRALLAPDGRWCAMKGQTPDAEIAALAADITTSVEPVAVPGLDAQRCLVWMMLGSKHPPAAAAQ